MNLRSVIFALSVVGCGMDPRNGSNDKTREAPAQKLPTEDNPLPPSTTIDGNTWIIGRSSLAPLLLTASKSGRELMTSDHWQDEDSILQTESLSTLDERDPKSTPPPVGIGPQFLSQGFDSQPVSIELVQFRPDIDAKKILDKWQQQGRILYYEPNLISSPKDSPFSDLSKQYGDAKTKWHQNIRLPEAFLALSDGTLPHENEEIIFDRAPVIAVIDSGVDIKHPLLEKAIWENPFPGLQCKDDSRGCNTSTNFSKDYLGDGEFWPVGLAGFGQPCDVNKQDTCNHGTHVSGIIAAYDTTNPIGVCPFCKILPIKVSRPKTDSNPGGISDSSIIRALQYLTQFSRDGQSLVRIANASFGKYQRSRSVASLVRKLANAAGGGTLLIAAASNEDSSQRAYPASISEVISVSALEDDRKKARFSNYGPSVDIAAPGTNIKSTIPGSLQKEDQGTSMASPVVAGVAGLVLALNPSMDAKTLRERLIRTADPTIYNDQVSGVYNGTYYRPKVSTGESIQLLGSGIVDALNALKGEYQPTDNPSLSSRVTPGCSRLSAQDHSFNGFYFLMLLPFFVFLTNRVFKSSAL